MAQRGMSVPTYAYALNNPLGYTDPSGLDASAAGWGDVAPWLPYVAPVLPEVAPLVVAVVGGAVVLGAAGGVIWIGPGDEPGAGVPYPVAPADPFPYAPGEPGVPIPYSPSAPAVPTSCEMSKGGKKVVTTTRIREEIGNLPKGTDICKYLKAAEQAARRAGNSRLALDYQAAWKEYCRGLR